MVNTKDLVDNGTLKDLSDEDFAEDPVNPFGEFLYEQEISNSDNIHILMARFTKGTKVVLTDKGKVKFEDFISIEEELK
jgi:hypothetical protein